MNAHQPALAESVFQVRDLGTRHGAPAFEILYFDQDIRAFRCSDNIWISRQQAEAEAASMEARGYQPRHWGRIDE